MKRKFIWSCGAVLAYAGFIALAVLSPEPASAQKGQAKAGDYTSTDKDTRPFDKHDVSGLWSRDSTLFGLPPCYECREHGAGMGYGYRGDVPPRTPEGEKRMNANHPARGFDLGSKEAAEHTELDIGMRRAIRPSDSNDPIAQCNPLGAPRLVTYYGGGASMELIQMKERIIQNFEWSWDHRDFWMDGRGLPDVDDYIPRYNGYSIAKWEGDVLHVTTTGFDDRAWVDHFGYPMSAKMVFEERYQRISPNRLQLDMTITDPLLYTRPWHSERKVWALIPKEKMAIAGWSGILEDRCIPTDEGLFTKFRDKAAGKTDGK
jgi:hypothetical protein